MGVPADCRCGGEGHLLEFGGQYSIRCEDCGNEVARCFGPGEAQALWDLAQGGAISFSEALERAQQAEVREREALAKVDRQRAEIKKIQASRTHAQRRLDRQQQCIAELVGELICNGRKDPAAAILDEFEIYL